MTLPVAAVGACGARRHHGTNPCATGIDRNNRNGAVAAARCRKAQARGIPQSAAQGRGTQRREPAGNASDHRRRYAFSRNACAYSTTVKQPSASRKCAARPRMVPRGSAPRACRPRSRSRLRRLPSSGCRRCAWFSSRCAGSSPWDAFGVGGAAALRLEDEGQLLFGAGLRLAFQRRLEQHGEHVLAADVLYHHLVLARRAVGGGDNLLHLGGEEVAALHLEHVVGTARQRVDARMCAAVRAGAVAGNDAREVVRAIADERRTLLAQRGEHKLAHLAVGQRIAGLGSTTSTYT